MYMAESEGFEPSDPQRSMVFKTIAIDHSANSPCHSVKDFMNLVNINGKDILIIYILISRRASRRTYPKHS